ncbi:MAG: hypothetical protein ACYCPQ_01080 [Elusimicrobiota bacterium]
MEQDNVRPRAFASPWIGALAMAAAMCSGYLFMAGLRGVWKSHYPELASRWANNGPFTVLGWYGTELAFEELGYADRANDQAHHLLAFDPYLRENRTWRQLSIDRLTYVILGGLDAALGGVNRAWLAARVLCCLAWFVLIYFLAERLAGYPPISFFCAAFITGFSYILTFLFRDNLVWSGGLFHIAAHNLWSVLSYGRTEGVLRLPRPGLTWAFLFLATLWAIKTAQTRSWRWAAASGILGGALAYVRLDVWSSYMAAMFFFSIAVSIDERRTSKPLLASLALSTLASLPFLLLNYPPDPDLLFKSGLLPRREFHPFSLIYLAAFALGFFRKKNRAALFCACLCAAAFIMVNIEIITGYPMAPEHWIFFSNLYVFFLGLAFIPRNVKRGAWAWTASAWALVAAAWLQGIGYAAIHYPFQGLPQNYAAALSWLDSHTAANSEVLSINPEILALIPAFTRDKTTAAFELAVLSDYPLLPNCERFTASLKVLGADPKKFFADSLFGAPEYERRQIIASGLYRGQIEKSDVGTFLFYFTPKNAVPKIISQAERRPAAIAPDYIWFGDLEKEYARPNFASAEKSKWHPVYSNRSVVIYGRTD